MSAPILTLFDPLNQVSRGLVSISVSAPQISGLGLVTKGFVWGEGVWALCCPDPSTSWSACASSPSTTWSAVSSDPSTTWEDC